MVPEKKKADDARERADAKAPAADEGAAEAAKAKKKPAHPAVEGPESGLPHGESDEAAALRAELEETKRALESTRGELEVVRKAADDNLARLKRTLADWENYRRRMKNETENARSAAREGLLKEFLLVLDNLDRALEHAGDEEALYEGVKLIYRQFRGALESQGLRRVDAEGHAFDPNVHEAVMREPTTGYKEGVVIKEFEKGYYLGDKLLRPAKVKVAVAPPEPPKGPEDDE